MEAIINHNVNQFPIPHSLPPARAFQSVWNPAHVLHPARDNYFRITYGNSLRSQADRFKTRGANLIDSKSRDFLWKTGFDGNLPGRVLPQSGLEDISQNYFINLRRIEPNALQGLFERGGAKIDRRNLAQ
jgi:hypothetical protein